MTTSLFGISIEIPVAGCRSLEDNNWDSLGMQPGTPEHGGEGGAAPSLPLDSGGRGGNRCPSYAVHFLGFSSIVCSSLKLLNKSKFSLHFVFHIQ